MEQDVSGEEKSISISQVKRELDGQEGIHSAASVADAICVRLPWRQAHSFAIWGSDVE